MGKAGRDLHGTQLGERNALKNSLISYINLLDIIMYYVLYTIYDV